MLNHLKSYKKENNKYTKNNITVIITDMVKIEYYKDDKLNIIICHKNNAKQMLLIVERLCKCENSNSF